MGKNSKLQELEKWLKRNLKNKVSINKSTVIAYLMAGFFGMSSIAYADYVIVNAQTGASGREDGTTHWIDKGSIVLAATSNQSNSVPSDKKALLTNTWNATNSVVIGSGGVGGGYVTYSESAIEDTVILGNNIVTNGKKIVAVGRGAKVTGEGGTAIGENTKSAAQGTSLGQNTSAAEQSTAIGSDVYATGFSAIAIGNDDIAKKSDGSASDYDDKLPENTIKRIYYDYTGDYNNNTINSASTALGNGMTKNDFDKKYIQDIVGTDVKDQRIYSPTFAKGLGAIAIGSRSVAFADVSTAVGTFSIALAPKSTAIGIRSFTDFNANGSLSIGEETRAFAANNISIGNRAEANSIGSLVIGANSISAGSGSVSVGQNVLSNAKLTTDSINNLAKRITKQYFTGQEGNTKGYLNSLNENYSPDTMTFGSYMNADNNPFVIAGFQSNQAQNKIKNMLSEVINGTTTTTTTGLNSTQTNPLFNRLNIDIEKETDVILTVGDGTEIKKTGKKGDNAISIGYYINNTGDNSIGLGTASLVLGSNAVSIGSLNFVAERAYNSISLGTGANVRRENSVVIGTGATSYGAGSVIVGSGSLGLGLNTVALGYGAITEKENTIALGNTARASKSNSMALGTKSMANGDNSIALGVEAYATLANSTSIGRNSRTDYNVADLSKPGWTAPGAVSIPTSSNVGIVSVGSIGQERRVTNVASGYKDTDAVNVAQLRTIVDRFNINSSDDTTLHFLSVNRKGNTTVDNYEKQKALKTYITLLGYKGQIEIRKGLNETIDQSSIQSIDGKISELDKLYSDLATNEKATAIKAITSNLSSKNDDQKRELFDALDKEVVKQTDAVNIEIKNIEESTDFLNTNYANNRATGENSIALGLLSYSPTKRSVTIGMEAKIDGNDSDEAIAIGDKAIARSRGAIAIGGSLSRNNYNDTTDDSAKATGKNSIAFGVNTKTDMEDSIAIGKSASIEKSSTSELRTQAIAIGASASVTNKEAIAIGANSNVTNRQGIGIGKNSKVKGNEGIAIGHGSEAAYNSAISIGTGAKNGVDANDARDSIAIGTYASAKRESGVAIGNTAEAYKESVAIGKSKAYYDNGIAIGKAKIYGNANIAIGTDTNIGAISNGTRDTTKGETEWAIVIGNSAKAYSTTGDKVTDAVVVGGNSQVTASSGVAIGNGATANIVNSIAIGKSSYTNNIAKGTYSQFAGNIVENSTSKANNGAFAIGNNATTTRQIQGVAAGTLDTDAVNVHQLKNMYLNIKTQVADKTETTVANVNLFTNPLVFKTNGDISIMADGTGNNTTNNKVMISLSGDISGANMTFKDKNNGEINLITKNSPELQIQEDDIDTAYKSTNLKVSVGQNGTYADKGLVKIGLKENPEFKSMTFKDNNTDSYLVIQKDGTNNTGLIKGLTKRKADTTNDYGTGDNEGRAATEGAVLALKNSIGTLSSKVKYRANSATDTADIKEVSLSYGLDFINGNNTTASVEDNGKIKFDVNSELKGITTIASATTNPKTTITLDTATNKIDVNEAKIRGLADGELNATSTDAVTGKQLFNLESKLGLNGNNEVSILDKVEALTTGTSGNLVYTDINGNRVEAIGGKYFSVKNLEDNGLKRAKDGKFYLQEDVDGSGTPAVNKKPQTAEEIINLGAVALTGQEVQLSTVNADGTTTKPTDIRNVASAIAPENLATLNKNLQDAKNSASATKDTDIKTAEEALITAAKKSTNTLFGKNDGNLNRVVTVGDLQSVAITGLEFGANGTVSDETVHRKLGEKLDIKGANANKFDETFSSDNVATKTTATGIEIGFKNNPNFSGLTLKSTDGTASDSNPTISIIPGTDGALTLSKPGTTVGTTAPVELKGIATGTTDDSVVNKKQLEDALSTSLNNTISLGVDNSKATATQNLNKSGGIKFNILGNDDITTSVANTHDSNVTISLNKASTVSATDEKAVTSKAVADYLITNYYTKTNVDNKLNDYDTATVAATKYLPKSTTINLKGSNGEAGTIVLNVTKPILEIVGGNDNITTRSENNKFIISIKDRPTFSGGLVAGDVTITPIDKNLAKQVEGLIGEERAKKLQELGLEESSLKGIIHANGYKIAHIADGEVAAGSKAAVNGGQLFEVKETAEGAKTQAEKNARDIKTNSGKITTLENKVVTNEGHITTLRGKVTTNETEIGTLKTKVSNNEASISTNSTNIDKGIKIVATNADAEVTSPTKLNLGDTINISQGDNITTTLKTGGNIEIALKNDLSFKTMGTSGLNGTPLTINSNNSGKISGLANGASDSDAINLGQIKPLATALNMQFKTDGTINNPSYTVGSNSYDNIQNALNAINTTASAGANGKITFANGSTTADIPLNQTINFNVDDTGNTNLLRISLIPTNKEFKFKVNNSPIFSGMVKANGFDANNNKISKVSAGTLDDDAVNFKQLKDVKDLIGVSSGNTVSFTLNAPVAYQATIDGADELVVKAKGATTETESFYRRSDIDGTTGRAKTSAVPLTSTELGTLKIATLDEDQGLVKTIKLTNLTAGDINDTSKDAIMGAQLKPVLDVLGMTSDTNNTVNKPEWHIGRKTYDSVASIITDGVTGKIGNTVLTTSTGEAIVRVGDDFFKVSELDSTALANNKISLNATLQNEIETARNNAKQALLLRNPTDKDGAKAAGEVAAKAKKSELAVKENDIVLSVLNPTVVSNSTTTALKLSNIADGVRDNDAINLSQLKKLGLDPNATAIKPVVTYDSDAKNTITLGTPASTGVTPIKTKITNLADGDISTINSTDAVTGGQLFTTNTNVSNIKYDINNRLNKAWNVVINGAKVQANDKVNFGDTVDFSVGNNFELNKSKTGTVHKLELALKENLTIGGLKIKNVKNSTTGATPAYTQTEITGLTNTTWNSTTITSGRAATEDQLQSAIQNVNTEAGKTDAFAVKYATSTADSTKPDYGVVRLTGENVTDASGTTNKGTLLTNLKPGTVGSNSTDAINGSQLYNYASALNTVIGGAANVGNDGLLKSGFVFNINDNNGNPSTVTNVKEAVESLNNGWRVLGGTTPTGNSFDGVAGATNVKRGQSLGIVSSGNISTKVEKKVVTVVPKYEFSELVIDNGKLYQKKEFVNGAVKPGATAIEGKVTLDDGSVLNYTDIKIVGNNIYRADDTTNTNALNIAKVEGSPKTNGIAFVDIQLTPTPTFENVTATKGGFIANGYDSTTNTATGKNISINADGQGFITGLENTKLGTAQLSTLTSNNVNTNLDITTERAATEDQLKEVVVDYIARTEKEIEFIGDVVSTTGENNPKIKLGQTINVKGGQNDASKLTNSNIGVVTTEGTKTLTVKLAKDLSNITSIGGRDNDGKLTFEHDTSGTGTTPTINANNAILKGLAVGDTPDSAVTKQELQDLAAKVGAEGATGQTGPAGRDGSTGPAGKDGLNGTNGKDVPNLSEKVNALRAGEAGTVVYTDKDGNRVVRDGANFYKASDLAGKVKHNGQWYNVNAEGKPDIDAGTITLTGAITPADVELSVVNPDGTTTNKTVLGNIAGNIELTGTTGLEEQAAGKITSLIGKTGSELNRAATVGDLKTLAVAGMNFGANGTASTADNTTHKKLGEKLSILGGGYFSTDFVSDNIATKVDSGNIVIGMKKTPKFTGVELQEDTTKPIIKLKPTGDGGTNPATLTLEKDGTTPADKTVVLSGLKDSSSDDTSAVTRGAFKDLAKQTQEIFDKTGLNGIDGNSTAGPAGKDGLNGTTIVEKITALRNGEAGNLVYVNSDGDRVVRDGNKFYLGGSVKAKNGNWYPKGTALDPVTGKPTDPAAQALTGIDPTDIQLAAVSPNGDTKSTPATIGNVKGSLADKVNASDYATTGALKAATDALNTAETSTSSTKDTDIKNAIENLADARLGGLLKANGDVLNKVATVGDLQVLAKNGLEFIANGNATVGSKKVTKSLGSRIGVLGGEEYDLATFTGNNIATMVDAKGDILVGMKKVPIFEGLGLQAPNAGGTANPIVSLRPDANGNLSLSKPGTSNLTGGIVPGTDKVVLTGLSDGTTPDSAVTKGALDAFVSKAGLDGTNGNAGPGGRDIVGTPGATGVTGATGPAGKDGLSGANGKDAPNLSEKINALRAGEAGSMVYTDADGNRVVRDGDTFYKAADVANLVKDTDGKWYTKDADGKPNKAGGEKTPTALTQDEASKIQLAAVDKDGSTIKPTVMGNIASTIAPNDLADLNKKLKDAKTGGVDATIKGAEKALVDGAKEAITGTNGLYNKTDAKDLAKAATVGDLQTLAIAGLDFGANGTTSTADNETHKKIGEKLSILGGVGNYFDNNFGSSNLVTKVADGNIEIGFKKTPEFAGIVIAKDGVAGRDGKDAVLTVDDKGNLIVKNGVDGVNGTNGTDGKYSEIITKDTLEGIVGKTDGTGVLGSNGRDGLAGPAGKDGLNGTPGKDTPSLTDKINALRNGEAGAVVYTDNKGNRVVRDGDTFYNVDKIKDYVKVDGKFYEKSDVENGVPKVGAQEVSAATLNAAKVAKENIELSAVSPDGGTKTATSLGNIASAIMEKANTVKVAETAVDNANKELTDVASEVATAAADVEMKKAALAKAEKDAGANVATDPAVAAAKTALQNAKTALTDKIAELGNKQVALQNAENNLENAISGLAAINAENAKDVVLGKANGTGTREGGLLEASGAVLNKVATVGDLQAVAQAGLDFETNDGSGTDKTIHKTLGSTLKIEGEKGAKFNDSIYSSENLVTRNDNGILRLGMLKTPIFDGIELRSANGNSNVSMVAENDGSLNLANNTGNVVIKGVKDGDTDDSVVTKGTLDKVIKGGFKIRLGGDDSKVINIGLGDTLDLGAGANILIAGKNKGTSSPVISVMGDGTISVPTSTTLASGTANTTMADGTGAGTGITNIIDTIPGIEDSTTPNAALGFQLPKEVHFNEVVIEKDGDQNSAKTVINNNGVNVTNKEGDKTVITPNNVETSTVVAKNEVKVEAGKDKAGKDVPGTTTVINKDGGVTVSTITKVTDKDTGEEVVKETSKVTINDGAISGLKDVALDENGMVAEKEQDKAVNGGTLNQSMTILREQVSGGLSQVNDRITDVEKRVQKVERNLQRGIANSVAQAGVKFQEIGKNQAVVGAAIGSYKGQQAVAVGVQAAPTENVRVHGIISVSPTDVSESAVSVGASWKFNLK